MINPRTSFIVPGSSRPRGDIGDIGECARHPVRPPCEAVAPGSRASGASEAGALGTTKEVLGIIIDLLAFNLNLLGFPIIVLGFLRIS